MSKTLDLLTAMARKQSEETDHFKERKKFSNAHNLQGRLRTEKEASPRRESQKTGIINGLKSPFQEKDPWPSKEILSTSMSVPTPMMPSGTSEPLLSRTALLALRGCVYISAAPPIPWFTVRAPGL